MDLDTSCSQENFFDNPDHHTVETYKVEWLIIGFLSFLLMTVFWGQRKKEDNSNTEMEDELMATRYKIEDLQIENSRMEELVRCQKVEFARTKDKLEGFVKDLKKELIEVKVRAVGLKSNLDEKLKKDSAMKREMNQLMRRTVDLEGTVKLEEKVRELESELKDGQKRIIVMRRQLEEKKEEVVQVRLEKFRVEGKVRQLEVVEEERKREMEGINEAKEELEGRVNGFGETVKLWELELKKAQDQVNELYLDIGERKRMEEVNRRNVEQIVGKNNELGERVDGLTIALRTANDRICKQVKEVNERKEMEVRLSRELRDKIEMEVELKRELEELQSQLNELKFHLENENANLEENLNQMQVELGRADEEVKSLNEMMNEKNSLLLKRQEELERCDNERLSLRQELEEQKGVLENLKNRNEQLEQDLELVKEQEIRETEMRNELEADLTKLSTELQEWKGKAEKDTLERLGVKYEFIMLFVFIFMAVECLYVNLCFPLE